jgi:hypothetical protein
MAWKPPRGGLMQDWPGPSGSQSIALEAFLTSLTQLRPDQWERITERAAGLGAGVTRAELVDGAVVAITVRHLLSVAHFELLYMPFAEEIPASNLPTRGPADN